MWSTAVTRRTTATKAQVWQLWTDVANWPRWDAEVASAHLSGPFAVGSRGVLKPKGGPQTKFVITECEPLHSFTDRSALPFCRLDFTHVLTDSPAGLQVTHRVQMSGPLTFLFAHLIGRSLAHGLPAAVERLVQLAETSSDPHAR